jgi:hypothetical protein
MLCSRQLSLLFGVHMRTVSFTLPPPALAVGRAFGYWCPAACGAPWGTSLLDGGGGGFAGNPV